VRENPIKRGSGTRQPDRRAGGAVRGAARGPTSTWRGGAGRGGATGALGVLAAGQRAWGDMRKKEKKKRRGVSGGRLTRGWCLAPPLSQGGGVRVVLPAEKPIIEAVKKKRGGGGRLTNADAGAPLSQGGGVSIGIWSLQNQKLLELKKRKENLPLSPKDQGVAVEK